MKKHISRYKTGTFKIVKYDSTKYGIAIVYYDADRKIKEKVYMVNGKRHRLNGPAYLTYDQNGTLRGEIYFRDGVFHREDGPAIIAYSNNGSIELQSYYLKGERYDVFKWAIMMGSI